MRYSETDYLVKLKNLRILPFKYYFLMNDLVIFHKVTHNLIPVSLPKELIQNKSRTRCSNNNLTYQLIESVSAPKQI